MSDTRDTVTVLANRLAAFGSAIRAAIDASSALGDEDTADLFTEVSRSIVKHLWFVEARACGRRPGQPHEPGFDRRTLVGVTCLASLGPWADSSR